MEDQLKVIPSKKKKLLKFSNTLIGPLVISIPVTPLPVTRFTKNAKSVLYRNPKVHMSRQMKILLTVSVINLCLSSFQGEKEEQSRVDRPAVYL